MKAKFLTETHVFHAGVKNLHTFSHQGIGQYKSRCWMCRSLEHLVDGGLCDSRGKERNFGLRKLIRN